MRSFALVEPKSPRMRLTLDAVETTGCRLLFGEEHARETFAICASLRRTPEGDSHGSFVSAVLWAGWTQVLHHCLGSDRAIRQTVEAHSSLRVHDPRLRELVLWLQDFGVERGHRQL